MAKNGLGRAIVIGLIGFAMATAGCGDNNSNSNGKLDGFLGTWQYTQSGGTYTCPGVAAGPAGISAPQKIWGEGVISDLVDLTFSCDYRFDVTNKTASIQPNQSCLVSDGAGGTATEMPSAWTFTLLSATSGEEKASTLNDLGCALEVTATLTKVSKD